MITFQPACVRRSSWGYQIKAAIKSVKYSKYLGVNNINLQPLSTCLSVTNTQQQKSIPPALFAPHSSGAKLTIYTICWPWTHRPCLQWPADPPWPHNSLSNRWPGKYISYIAFTCVRASLCEWVGGWCMCVCVRMDLWERGWGGVQTAPWHKIISTISKELHEAKYDRWRAKTSTNV